MTEYPKSVEEWATELAQYHCPWCESNGREATLEFRHHPHDGGLLAKTANGLSREWIYGQCLGCSHEWSIAKLRAATLA